MIEYEFIAIIRRIVDLVGTLRVNGVFSEVDLVELSRRDAINLVQPMNKLALRSI